MASRITHCILYLFLVSRVRPLLEISLTNTSGRYEHKKLFPKSGYNGHSNFGAIDAVGKGEVVLNYIGGENYEHISILKVAVYKDSSKTSTLIFCIAYVLFLVAAAHTRKNTFKDGFYRGAPYVFISLVAITSIAWVALA